MLENLHIPGAFWLALIAFIVEWLPQLFPGAPWLPIALLALMALAKADEAAAELTIRQCGPEALGKPVTSPKETNEDKLSRARQPALGPASRTTAPKTSTGEQWRAAGKVRASALSSNSSLMPQ